MSAFRQALGAQRRQKPEGYGGKHESRQTKKKEKTNVLSVVGSEIMKRNARNKKEKKGQSFSWLKGMTRGGLALVLLPWVLPGALDKFRGRTTQKP